MVDPILERAFRYDRVQEMIQKMNDVKKLNKTVLRNMTNPQFLVMVYEKIRDGQYEISPPSIVLISKDKPGEFRECKVNMDYDRCILSLINDSLFELTKDVMISKNCTSYQKGLSCQATVQDVAKRVSKLITKLDKQGYKHFIMKGDLSRFFDNCCIEKIDESFDRAERHLGFEPGTLPSVTMLRKYYHSDWLFDENGELIQMFTSLKQGSSVASWLADVILKDLDDMMTEMCDLYVRYSDDVLIVSTDLDNVYNTLANKLTEYGLQLNPKKVEFYEASDWISFLGMKIKKNMVTLSKNRVHNFQKEIFNRTVRNQRATTESAKRSVINYLYKGEYNWSSACLPTINVKADIDELNKFVMDCIRLCELRDKRRKEGKKIRKYTISDLGGLGSVNNLPDRTILRGTGHKVKTARERTNKTIPNYLSMGCLEKDYKIGKVVFEAAVRGL